MSSFAAVAYHFLVSLQSLQFPLVYTGFANYHKNLCLQSFQCPPRVSALQNIINLTFTGAEDFCGNAVEDLYPPLLLLLLLQEGAALADDTERFTRVPDPVWPPLLTFDPSGLMLGLVDDLMEDEALGSRGGRSLWMDFLISWTLRPLIWTFAAPGGLSATNVEIPY